MPTLALTLYVPDDLQEWLIAELSDLDCTAFEPEEDVLRAYVPVAQWDDTKREHVQRWLAMHGLDPVVEEQVVADQNWNAQWEASIRPIAAGPFLVKPTWQPVPPAYEGLQVIEVDPKMSFGTGHHASTRLVLRALPRLIDGGEQVLDAGTGTGILAIAAILSGAEEAIAFDVDPWVEDNVRENLALNGVADRVVYRTGTIDVVPERGFDVILANINRHALVDLLPTFAAKLAPNGHIVLAGLLQQDQAVMKPVIADAGLTPVQDAAEGEWWSVVLASA